MSTEKEALHVRVDTYTRVCLGVIAVLLAVLIVGLWAERDPAAGPVHAQVRAKGLAPKGPFLDTSTQTQLVQIVKEQRKTTEKVAELISLFRSGQVQVKVEGQAGGGKGGGDAAKPRK